MREPTPQSDWLRALADRVTASLRGRGGVLASLATLALCAAASRTAWEWSRPALARDPRYAVTRESVLTPDPPPWLRRDVIGEAFATAGLDGTLSVLSPPPDLEGRLASALAAHPWVRRVGRIAKAPPNRVSVELEYRSPLAAVEASGAIVAIDADGAVLPPGDLPSEAVRHLPRVDLPRPATSQPAVGVVWADPRLGGAVALVESLGGAWDELHLFRIRAGDSAETRAGRSFWTYELVSTGNTVVLWGAAPGFEPPGEKPFADKLATLRQASAKYGPLDSVATSPALIDVRARGNAYPRVVMKDGPRVAAGEGAVR